MRIARGRFHPAVTEEPADDRQPFAERERPRGEGCDVGRENRAAPLLWPQLRASVGELVLHGIGAYGHGEVGPMTVLASGDSGWRKVTYSVFVRSGGDGGEQTTEPSRRRSGRTRNRGCPGDGITG